ncbi:hypothetical protein [Gloeocapsa sp. PCC 73106]|uniref:hypothetical protein n=1 Tax=Gloeocapsa sp. PCC 73106 TaxID=102232 RepID=UPI0002ABF1B0|nr:hypothetical protein [Gloeocapsa sp. PCC 73106]ELR97857.1 hypothetical protein GLO73106DRAFT_00016740 [Gloeocapsa sp. PCC 73106]
MNPKLSPLSSLSNSGLGCLLTLILTGFLLGSLGLGWVVHSFLILIGLLFLVPIVAWLGLNWWLRGNVVTAPCPLCSYEFTSLNNNQCQCPNCGELLEVKGKILRRITPPGTIDVTVVDD